ncbi:hypothetical protein RB195_013911 [Necator americanus]|uniref:Uncharacterized protein n=1 Tax=Necator americanus TaxID=51031 RepID=A0ABR1DXP3_NECAM
MWDPPAEQSDTYTLEEELRPAWKASGDNSGGAYIFDAAAYPSNRIHGGTFFVLPFAPSVSPETYDASKCPGSRALPLYIRAPLTYAIVYAPGRENMRYNCTMEELALYLLEEGRNDEKLKYTRFASEKVDYSIVATEAGKEWDAQLQSDNCALLRYDYLDGLLICFAAVRVMFYDNKGSESSLVLKVDTTHLRLDPFYFELYHL